MSRSTEQEQSKLSNSSMTKLKNRVDEIAPLLDLEGEWTVHDIDGDVHHLLRFLKREGAITSVEKEWKSHEIEGQREQGTSILNVWRWNEPARQWLKEKLENRDELPCGHQKHIYNPREMDGFSCRYCAEQDKQMPEYSREQIEEWL